MLFEDREPFGFGWMSCQHGLDPDLVELRRHQ